MDKRIRLSRRHFVKRISTALAVQALPLAAYCKEKDGLTIACLCDPQLGFYTSSRPVQGYAADLANLHQAVKQINKLKPDIVLVAGDMVQTLGKKSATDVNDALAVLSMSYMLTPGNHDISPPVTKKKIDAYQHYFGSDRVSREIKGFKIVSGNSQLWTKGVAPELVKEHNAWFRKEVRAANSAGMPVIVMTHIPPFVKKPDEKDAYFNVPMPYRQELLDFCADNGVFAYIAGHTHRTHRNEYRGISILNGETTSTNFDDRPAGYRVLRIKRDKTFSWLFTPLEK